MENTQNNPLPQINQPPQNNLATENDPPEYNPPPPQINADGCYIKLTMSMFNSFGLGHGYMCGRIKKNFLKRIEALAVRKIRCGVHAASLLDKDGKHIRAGVRTPQLHRLLYNSAEKGLQGYFIKKPENLKFVQLIWPDLFHWRPEAFAGGVSDPDIWRQTKHLFTFVIEEYVRHGTDFLMHIGQYVEMVIDLCRNVGSPVEYLTRAGLYGRQTLSDDGYGVLSKFNTLRINQILGAFNQRPNPRPQLNFSNYKRKQGIQRDLDICPLMEVDYWFTYPGRVLIDRRDRDFCKGPRPTHGYLRYDSTHPVQILTIDDRKIIPEGLLNPAPARRRQR